MIRTEPELENLLSAPSDADVQAAARLEGDVIVLGAAGKMGPSFVARLRRSIEARQERRTRVFSVTRSGPIAVRRRGARRADVLDRLQVMNRLPDAGNVIYMVGRKFGSTGNEPLTWAVNALAPALVARALSARRASWRSRQAMSTPSRRSIQAAPPDPLPRRLSANTRNRALARERIFEYYSTSTARRWFCCGSITRSSVAMASSSISRRR